MTENCWTGLELVVGLKNGQLEHILINDSTEGLGNTAGGSGVHIWGSERSGLGSGVVRDNLGEFGDCFGGFGLSLDTNRVCLEPFGYHGYDNKCASFTVDRSSPYAPTAAAMAYTFSISSSCLSSSSLICTSVALFCMLGL